MHRLKIWDKWTNFELDGRKLLNSHVKALSSTEELFPVLLMPSDIIPSMRVQPLSGGGRIMTTLVDDCRLAVQGLIEAGNNIRLLWVPGYTGIPGNEKGDELARAG